MRITSDGLIRMDRTVATDYLNTGNTIRTANGRSHLVSFDHGYYTPQRVASIAVNTVSNSGGIWGAGNLEFYTGTSGNGDNGTGLYQRMLILWLAQEDNM